MIINKRRMKLEKRGIVWLFVVLFGVVFSLILINLSTAQTTPGCFTKPSYIQSSGSCGWGMLPAVAMTSCNNNQSCYDQYYYAGQSCANVWICQQAAGWCTDTCTQVGYVAQCEDRSKFLSGSRPPICDPGCCICTNGTNNICSDTSGTWDSEIQVDCGKKCAALSGNYRVGYFNTTTNSSECTTACGTTISATTTVSGQVVKWGAPTVGVVGARVEAAGVVTQTDNSGNFQLTNLPTGTIRVTGSKIGYDDITVEINSSGGTITGVQIALPLVTTGTVYGTVTDGTNPVSGAMVSIAGATSYYQTITDSSGYYRIDVIWPVNQPYVLTASKTGFAATMRTKTLTSGAQQEDFTLGVAQQGYINGVVSDGGRTGAPPLAQAQVWIGNNLVALTDSQGKFNVSVLANSTGINYSIHFSKSGFQTSQTIFRTVSLRQQVNVGNTVLVPFISTCGNPNKPAVSNFSAYHVLGTKAVRLTWTKPCNEVAGFMINKTEGGISGVQSEVAYLAVVDPQQMPLSFIDTQVSWDKSYVYKIWVVYDDQQVRLSPPMTASITTGDPICEGKLLTGTTTTFSEFCVNRTLRMSCNNQNKLYLRSYDQTTNSAGNCATQGSNYYCYGPYATGSLSGKTECRLAACSSGIWPPLVRTSCYGINNFCYWDQVYPTGSSQCYPCSRITNCFNYDTQDACVTNGCLGDRTCNWIPSTLSNTVGWCVEQNYNKTDHCLDCSQSGRTGKTSGCTQTICSALGSCFSQTVGTSQWCTSCSSQTKCFDLKTQSECEGGQAIVLSTTPGMITPSNDICGLGKCKWDANRGTNGECIKDGNVDNTAECDSATNQDACQKDNVAPVTRIVIPSGYIGVGGSTSLVTFEGVDTSGPMNLSYCVDVSNTCVPSVDLSYPSTSNRLTVNLANSSHLLDVYRNNQGRNRFYLRFRSLDKYYNLENVKSTGIAVDLSGPQIYKPIQYTLTERVNTQNQGDSQLDFIIVTTEPATCTDQLVGVNHNYQSNGLTGTQFTDSFNVTYKTLPDGLYNYSVICQDVLGNFDSAIVIGIKIDAVKSIIVSTPIGATNLGTQQNPLRIILNTPSDNANCVLYAGSPPPLSNENPMQGSGTKQHVSQYYTLADGQYQNYWAECTFATTNTKDQTTIPFTVDHSPPVTSLDLTSRGLTRTVSGNFREQFSDNTQAILKCNDQPPGGFGCDSTKKYWCFATNFQGTCTPTSTLAIPLITSDKTICYYSVDLDNNAESVSCGDIEIKPGLGVRVVDPSHGVSPVPSFNLTISTGIETDLCKFGLIANTNFSLLTDNRTFFTHVSNFEHKIDDFVNNYWIQINGFPTGPDDSLRLWVVCNRTNGEIGIAEPIDLVYDPSAPTIQLSTDPASPITGGQYVELVVRSNEDTICKFSSTAASYNDMQQKFPRYDLPDFKTEHREQIAIGASGTFTYKVACENEAELVSQVGTITYTVDLNQQGTITQTAPTGPFQNQTVLLEVWTNKPASCSYALGGSTPTMNYANQQLYHYDTATNLNEGIYSILVTCGFQTGSPSSSTINFVIDKTKPYMKEIDDGTYSCSLTKVNAEFDADDNLSTVNEFEYQLLTKVGNNILATGNTTSTTATVSGLNLTLGDDYYFKVRPKDSAGNWGDFMSSNGFEASHANRSECIDKGPPTLSFSRNLTISGMRISVNCNDETGCVSINYGTASTAGNCSPTMTYQNIPILLTSTAYVCASATDSIGNQANKTERVYFGDEDGDGVGDRNDLCPGTQTGKTVNEDGCSSQQLNIDTDHDRLPDWWEIQNDYLDCQFNFQEQDSDNNGIDDDLEDYNKNGILNYEEYMERADPCAIEDGDRDGIADGLDQCPNTPPAETSLVIKDENNPDYGCGPSEVSTLGDGIDDAWRQRYFGCITCPQAAADADPDEDGLTNLQEYNLKNTYGKSTNPTRKDTDFDGIDDKEEVDNGWDPTDANSPYTGGEAAKSSFFAWLLLILGLLMAIGGVVYLVIIKFATKPKVRKEIPVPTPVARTVRVAGPRPVVRPMPEQRRIRAGEYEELVAKRKAEREAERRSRISKIFGVFGGKTEPLPHFEKILAKKDKPVFDKLTEATHHYMTGKEHVLPRLSKGERNVFEELTEKIKKPTKAEIRKVLKKKPQQEMHETFNKLVDMINRHNEGKNFDNLKKNVKK